MECGHGEYRCTNGVFYCLKCGAVVPNPYESADSKGGEEKRTEAKKTPLKRKAKKGEDK